MQVPLSGEGGLARINLIYVGPLDSRHHVQQLADAFLAARDHDPRLHLLLAGDGDEHELLRRRLGRAGTFLGARSQRQLDELAHQADLLICPTTDADTAAAIATAQRAGLPVLAVEGGDAAALIENGRSGFLIPDDDATLADAIRWLARRATLRERLATGGRLAVAARLAANPRSSSGPGPIMTA